MTKIKEFTVPLTEVDKLDIRLIQKKNQITGFVINYRAKIKDKWHEIYRVDTCHGYLHEQRFWLSPRPIKLPRQEPLKFLFDFYLEETKERYEKYKKYYKNGI